MTSFQGIRLESPPSLKGYKLTGQGGFVDPEARRGWLAGRWVLPGSGNWNSQIAAYDLDSGQELYRFDAHDYLQWLYWHAPNQRLLIGFAGPAWIWERPEELGLRLTEDVCPAFRSIARWPGQTLLANLSGVKQNRDDPDDIVHFDPASLQVLQTWKLQHAVSCLASCPDGSQLAIAGRKGKKFQLGWGPAPDQLQLTEAPGKAITTLRCLPDGSSLAVGRLDGKLEIWDTGTGRVLQTLLHPKGGVLALPDLSGTQLFTTAADFVIRQWDLATGQVLRDWREHTDYITDLALSADGRRLYSGSCDRTLRWWDL